MALSITLNKEILVVKILRLQEKLQKLQKYLLYKFPKYHTVR